MNRLIVIAILFTSGSLFGQEEKRDISKGNDCYEQGDFTEAGSLYESSLARKPKMLEANFNLGNALFRQEDYGAAARQFEQASKLADKPADKAKAFHNLGNSYLKSAEQMAKSGQMQGVNGMLQQSIESYKSALRNDPGDNETRYNLALAKKLLKEQEEQNQQNQQQQDQNQEQDQQDQEQKQDQEEKQDQQQEQEQDQQDQQNPEEQKDQQDQSQQPQPKPQDEISKEDAQRLLEAMKNEEEETQDKLKKNKFQKVNVNIEKDW